MSYKYSKGSQVIGDLKAADDTERNTLIDFGEDQIEFQTSGSVRLQISNDHVSSSLPISASVLHYADSIKIAGAPPGEDTVIDNQGNFYGNSISVGTVSGSNIVVTDGGSPVYQLPIADGTSDQVMKTDGVGNITFDSVANLGIPSFIAYGYNGTFTGTGPIETTTVNGSTNDYGYRIPADGQVTHITTEIQYLINTSGTYDFIAEVYKNGAVTGQTGSVTISGGSGAANNTGFVKLLDSPISFVSGDRLTIKMNFDAAGIQADDAALLLRVVTTN
jgi:hypothetical protein